MSDHASGLFPAVDSPDLGIAGRVSAALATSVRGRSFGRVGELGAWIAACRGEDVPTPFARPHALIFAGDHGVARRGVSAHSPASGPAQVAEAAAGGGPVNVAARSAGCAVRLVDDWLDAPTGSIDVEDAMTPEQFEAALARGRELADQEVDAGTDLIVPGDIGVGNTTVAAAVFGALTGTEPVAAVGRGSGINDNVWKVKTAAVRDAMFRVRGFRGDVPRVLASISAADFVALVGLIAQAAARRTPLLIDGPYTTVAAYVAERLAPGTRHWLAAAQLSAEPCQQVCLKALDLTPLMALDMATGQGAGALMALPLLNSAAEMVGDEVASLRAD
ncbi:nicotinate-nucleotide--dimethylbenzimidazole phosphoribosyltransferase [uncultured Corynebacterium sp.]|uniref:nicotinate-nucleotide--dimethylbenzimidazole phosphoribosyltransferase n=1 Tax=uncultured Corynebacterium sp. TaxID=159447 RepID=UPI002599268F|nr:nicotinate-nucleotide--dimethylbenzimidazole phosphoribosyltransferase [uncultured Corynebacterium sp.]